MTDVLHWEDYSDVCPEKENLIRILLDCNPDMSLAKDDELWSTKFDQHEYHAAYRSMKRSVFSIRYANENNLFHVSVPYIQTRVMSLGIQHALMLALASTCIGLHCVTVNCHNQTILLSAPSGTGKSTLAGLLQRYGNAEVINGDFALLSIDENGTVIFEPTPFCGSSGICQNKRLPVDQIVFLSQDSDIHTDKPDTLHALQLMLSNTFVPEWDRGRSAQIKENIFRIIENIPIRCFAFSPDENAVKCFYRDIVDVPSQ